MTVRSKSCVNNDVGLFYIALRFTTFVCHSNEKANNKTVFICRCRFGIFPLITNYSLWNESIETVFLKKWWIFDFWLITVIGIIIQARNDFRQLSFNRLAGAATTCQISDYSVKIGYPKCKAYRTWIEARVTQPTWLCLLSQWWSRSVPSRILHRCAIYITTITTSTYLVSSRRMYRIKARRPAIEHQFSW